MRFHIAITAKCNDIDAISDTESDIIRETLPHEMQTVVREMDDAVDRLRKLYCKYIVFKKTFMEQNLKFFIN